ncbi:unnamed protein product [Caenorhabditis auriculariae]|uniref:DUF7741 domain-containing protein n=1 Tax=Caenorhabditis auriculariae TaxID=2777116 RepID=A0A8S1HJ63_9PELO|nr:unnamed protein product [Caenorhabditis auriculariae]
MNVVGSWRRRSGKEEEDDEEEKNGRRTRNGGKEMRKDPKKMIPLALLLAMSWSTVLGQNVVCFECYGNSSSQGQFCSIDKLCVDHSCFFEYSADGVWSAGCSSETASSTVLQCSLLDSGNKCTCNTDFCNSLDAAKEVAGIHSSIASKPLRAFRSKAAAESVDSSPGIAFAVPNSPMIYCHQCGNVTVGSESRDIPCDLHHTCQGNYCVMKRGQSPYAYCGTIWEGEEDPACTKYPDQPERCICEGQMCNVLLSPQTFADAGQLGPVLITEPPPTLAQPVAPNVPPTAPPGKKCKNGKFSPNNQAVFMGEKLKDVILNGFGSDSGAIQNFEDDVNDHICNYSEDDDDEASKK